MSLTLINRLRITLQKCETNLIALITGHPPVSPEFSIDGPQKCHLPPPKTSLKDIIGDGFLWAVPRTRRTIEKRWRRKFGNPFYVWKPLVPKTNLQVCNTCGHDHEIGILCANCYEKVREETKAMQEVIQSELKLDPVEKEVVVLYDGEKPETDEFWKGKRIVEMKKPRPAWFSKNLLQKTTQGPATTTDVKPSNLG